MATIAERIQEGMNLRGLKQVDIIEKTGMNKGALSSYLSGKYKPKQDKIYLLAKALDVSEAWLMGYDVPIERKEYFSLQVSKKEKDLLVKFNLLNESGQTKAVEYVSDLADNPKYTADRVCEPEVSYIPTVLAAHHETGLPDDDDMEHINAAIQFAGKLKRQKGEL